MTYAEVIEDKKAEIEAKIILFGKMRDRYPADSVRWIYWDKKMDELFAEKDAVAKTVRELTGEQADIDRWTPEEKEADEVAKNFNFDSIAPIEF